MDNLNDYFLTSKPIESFSKWFLEAKKIEQNPEAMTLATVSKDEKRAEARTLLFKGFKGEALVFYTNYLSQKGRELEINKNACLLFYWYLSKRQVKIQGSVEKMSDLDSDLYFKSRDRESQIASFVSEQSAPISDKKTLLEKVDKANIFFQGKDIPRPKNWGGYIFTPYEFEFFVYGEHRINDRFFYKKSDNDWVVTRLQP